MNKVLVIDTNESVLEMVGERLRRAGFRPITVADGLSALKDFYNHHPSLVILEIRLPSMDGWTFLSRIREVSSVPVIVLTALNAERVKLRAFSLGVDDYVTKPFSCAVLVARVKAILRRVSGNGSELNAVFNSGDLTVDLTSRRVIRKGEVVSLTPTEFCLLTTLARHQGRPLSHEYLLAQVWGYEGKISYLKRYVWSLRQKLEDDPASPTHIVTERAFGYRFD